MAKQKKGESISEWMDNELRHAIMTGNTDRADRIRISRDALKGTSYSKIKNKTKKKES